MNKKSNIVLALVLASVMTLCPFLSAFADSASSDELNVIVASDLHYMPVENIGSVANSICFPESELYSRIYDTKMMYESEAIVRSFLDEAAASDAQCVLIPGDLVHSGNEYGHRKLAGLFNEFEASTGKQIYISVGNHDINGEVDALKMMEIYNNFGFSEALSRDETTPSYSADIGGKYRLISISNASYHNKQTAISSLTLQWVKEQCEAAKADGKTPIAMTHVTLLEHFAFPVGDVMDKITDMRIENADDIYGLFADWGIKYIFTGHVHFNDISRAVSKNNNEIYDVVTGTLIGYPCTYRSVKFTDSSVEFKANSVTEIDTDFLPDGYSEVQIEKMKTDFAGYSRGAMDASLQFTLKSFYVKPTLAIDYLTVDPNSPVAQFVCKVLPPLYEVMCLPLYEKDNTGNGSFEALAESYGTTLPETEFKTFFEIGGYIFSSVIAGDENIPTSSDEFKLFWECMKIALIFSTDGLEEEADALLQSYDLPFSFEPLRAFATEMAFRKSAVTKLMQAFLFPLLDNVLIDDGNPADLNVTLPPCGVPASGIAFLNNILTVLRAVAVYIKRFFSVLLMQ